MRTFIKTSISKKSGKLYTALYVESDYGYPIAVTFDMATLLKISQVKTLYSLAHVDTPVYLDEEE